MSRFNPLLSIVLLHFATIYRISLYLIDPLDVVVLFFLLYFFITVIIATHVNFSALVR